MERRCERRDEDSAADSEQHAEGATEEPLQEGLPGDLANDQALRPAESLQRPELAYSLGHGREREQARDQESGEQPDHREGSPELRGDVLRVDERARDSVREVLRRRDRGPGQRLLDVPREGSDLPGARCADIYRVDPTCTAGRLLELRELDVEVGAGSAGRRLRKTDDRVGLAGQ